jgi:imidazolonepropionase-like amidohydrolase
MPSGGLITVLPGLIDTHVHLLASDKVTNEEELTRYIEDVVRGNLIGFLAHGVTTIKSIGDPEDGILELRARVESGKLIWKPVNFILNRDRT